MKNKAISVLKYLLYSNDNERQRENCAIISENPIMSSGVTKFANDNLDNIVSDNKQAICSYVEKGMKNFGTTTKDCILQLIKYRFFDEENTSGHIKVFEEAIKYEDDNIKRQIVYRELNSQAKSSLISNFLTKIVR